MSFDDHLKLSSTSQEVVVTTKDGDQFTVDASLLRQCKALGLADHANLPVNLAVNEVSTPIFKKVLEWCEEHKDAIEPVMQYDQATPVAIWFTLTDFEKRFFDVPVENIMELLTAANYLNLKSMYLFGCHSFADLMKGKNPEELCQFLGLEGDMTEIEKIRKENLWCKY